MNKTAEDFFAERNGGKDVETSSKHGETFNAYYVIRFAEAYASQPLVQGEGYNWKCDDCSAMWTHNSICPSCGSHRILFIAQQSPKEEAAKEERKAVRLPDFHQNLFNYLSNELGVIAMPQQLFEIADIIAPYQYPYKMDEQYLQEASPAPTREIKYPIGGYAPGNYSCTCRTCGNLFQGDKRAVQCEPCATNAPAGKGVEGEEWKEIAAKYIDNLPANVYTTHGVIEWIDKHVASSLKRQLTAAQEENERLKAEVEKAYQQGATEAQNDAAEEIRKNYTPNK